MNSAIRRRSRLVGVWLVSLLVIGGNCWRPAWSGDEAATVSVVRRSLAQVWRTVHFDPALALYYVVMKAWALVSTSELWLRLPSVLAATTAVTAVSVLTARHSGPRAGTFAALVMLAMPATSRYGQEARPYALMLLLVVLAVLVWDSGRVEDPGRVGAPGRAASRRWRQAGLTSTVALAGALHPYALLVVPVLVVASFWAPSGPDRRREVLSTTAACGAAVLLLLPFLIAVGRGAQGQPNPPEVSAAAVIEEFVRLPAGVLSPPLAVPAAITTLGLAAVGIVVGWLRGEQARRAAVLAAIWLLMPPLALCLLQVTTGAPGLVARYWIASLGAIGMAAAFSLDALWTRSRGAALVAGLVVVGLSVPTHVGIRKDDGHLGQRWRELPQILRSPVVPGMRLLAEGWSYRALVSNDPTITFRMPMVVDPAPSGRVNPDIVGTDSPEFRRMSREHDVVLVLQAESGYQREIPTTRSFRSFRAELRTFATADVLCIYFGEPLGVFSKAPTTIPDGDARVLAAQIVAMQPDKIRCVAPGNG